MSAYANLPALTAEELGLLEEMLSYHQAFQTGKKTPMPALNRNILRHLLSAVHEAQKRGERRVVRENSARSPARDLQETFVEEARLSMGQPSVGDVNRYLGKLVCVSFNHIEGTVTGILTALDPGRQWILLDGEERIPLRSVQSIVLPEGGYPPQEHTGPQGPF